MPLQALHTVQGAASRAAEGTRAQNGGDTGVTPRGVSTYLWRPRPRGYVSSACCPRVLFGRG